ncbi:hypothetical protein OS493_028759 [Desmophyllum pertusum]|uniref:G domain-containing protein n=1 Tax=Desmophyllum pertusum TaxID=174260 RepID=A0A9W9Y941_9CNID|nr:hypothetical protein OS493_028759 [Desmophyllum pertusum]
MASSTKQLEDKMLRNKIDKIIDYKVGEYEEFHDALEGEMEGCCVNIALFGMTGSGKSALINTIFQALDLESQPAVTQSTGKEGTKILEGCVLPGRQITLYDTRELFRILFGIERSGDDLTRDDVSAQKAAAAGVGAHRLKKPPIADQIHVVLWVIKANDVRFQTGQYREIIKFVQDQLKQAIVTVITVITFDDEIQKKPNAEKERERLREAAIEVTGSDKRNVFMIANYSVRGWQEDHGSVYKKRVLAMLEKALRDKAEKSNQRIFLFNCDGTYKLDVVERFLMATEEKHGFKFSIDKRYFSLKQMAEVCETTIPQLQMEFAIFVVHAEESRLSINEDNAGIGYARIYRAFTAGHR